MTADEKESADPWQLLTKEEQRSLRVDGREPGTVGDPPAQPKPERSAGEVVREIVEWLGEQEEAYSKAAHEASLLGDSPYAIDVLDLRARTYRSAAGHIKSRWGTP